MTNVNDFTPTTNAWTPSTTDIVAFLKEGGVMSYPGALSDEEYNAAIDRWLAAHDRTVAAKALRDAATDLELSHWSRWSEHGNDDITRDAEADASAWLDDRADRIEQNGEGQ